MDRFSKIIFSLIFCLFSVISVSAQIITETVRIDGDGLRNLLPKKDAKKPVLINFWATWCGPCRVEFPELVKIDADYRAKNLNFVIVSIDNLGAMDSVVADFLKSYDSTMPSYLLDLSPRREIFKAIRQIAPTAQNGFPLTLLYNKNGKLVYQKNGVVDARVLRAKIDKVLAVKTE